MKWVTSVIVFAVLFCAWSGTSASDSDDGSCSSFGFGEEQEKEWGRCSSSCNDNKQSPIDVESKNAITEDLSHVNGPFYQDRSIPFHFNLSNDNYTVTVQLLDADYLYLEGGPLYSRYFLHNLQFCWGSDDSKGSDHSFNGVKYPLEAQWALFSEEYTNYEQASKYPGGVLRISQLYPLQDEDNPSLAPIVRALPEVVKPGQTTEPDEELTYDEIFSGYPVDDYYYYNGSFTTPPCTETVMWFVYAPLNGVSESQLEVFRTLQSTNGPLVNNFRTTQPLNGRKVIRSNKSSTCLGECETSSKSERRRSGTRHQATKSGRHSKHGASKHHGAARRRQH
ncbi:carbonic anhydrase 6-like [Schistocerca cancellata]|uniref:carbonic anhydrase 6-like n=1 Tax=Schistocerca cancellata TaxID=274614 RepID=UPI002117BBAB|nr:carbonic anhydrase 6-like [Schistocerca cancellata]